MAEEAPPTITELPGSRAMSSDNDFRYGTMLFASTTATDAGIPVARTTFFTPPGGAQESGLFGRKCIKVDVTPDKPLPGLFHVIAQFAGIRGY